MEPVIFYLLSLHLLLVVLSLGCKVFISASPRMQWYCRCVMKNSVLTHKVSLIWETASPSTQKPKIINEITVELNHTKCYCKRNKIT